MSVKKQDAKHTPGPWVVSEHGDRPENKGICTPSGKVLVEVSETVGLNEADARLIAAAPDFMALAQKALASHDNFGPWTAKEEAMFIAELREIVAKAQGDR